MQEQPFTVSEEPTGQDPEPPNEAPGLSLLKLLGSGLLELGETVLPAIVIAVLINLFLAQATRVYGSSMEPNLYTDQALVGVQGRLHTVPVHPRGLGEKQIDQHGDHHRRQDRLAHLEQPVSQHP